jgi:hypothetical protein
MAADERHKTVLIGRSPYHTGGTKNGERIGSKPITSVSSTFGGQARSRVRRIQRHDSLRQCVAVSPGVPSTVVRVMETKETVLL